MNIKQRWNAALCGKEADRIPMMEISFWPDTIARWQTEGFPEGADPVEYFGLDSCAFFEYDGSHGFSYETRPSPKNGSIQYRDGNGVWRERLEGVYTPPSVVETELTCAEDFEKYRHLLLPNEGRIPAPYSYEAVTSRATKCQTMEEYYNRVLAEGLPAVLTPIDPIWFYLTVLPEEQALCDIAENPGLVGEIVTDYTEFNIGMYKLLYSKGYRFDSVWFFSDLCYKNGMLFSPDFYRRHVLPHLKRYVDLCHEGGSSCIFHCDGNVTGFIPLLIEAGIDCIQPLEARAGCDVRELSCEYENKISYFGNISMDVLASDDKDAIRHEVVSKIEAGKQTRRYLYHSDHSVPPGVSFDNYRYAIELVKEHGVYK